MVGVPLAKLLILLQNKYINNLTLGSGAHHLPLIFHRLGILRSFWNPALEDGMLLLGRCVLIAIILSSSGSANCTLSLKGVCQNGRQTFWGLGGWGWLAGGFYSMFHMYQPFANNFYTEKKNSWIDWWNHLCINLVVIIIILNTYCSYFILNDQFFISVSNCLCWHLRCYFWSCCRACRFDVHLVKPWYKNNSHVVGVATFAFVIIYWLT